MPAQGRLRRRSASRAAGRVDFVDACALSSSVTNRYLASYPDLTDRQLDRLVAATRQWCRLLARAPRAKIAMPSAAVGELWAEMVAESPFFAGFCAAAFGRMPRPKPVPPAAPGGAVQRSPALRKTYLLASADEGLRREGLPLLFRVDWMLDRLDGLAYVPNCGQVRYCVAPEGTTCLRHVARPPRSRVSHWGGPAAGGTKADGTGGVSSTSGLWI